MLVKSEPGLRILDFPFPFSLERVSRLYSYLDLQLSYGGYSGKKDDDQVVQVEIKLSASEENREDIARLFNVWEISIMSRVLSSRD